MASVDELIGYQIEKRDYLKAYLAANEMLEERAKDQNFLAMKELIEKKQAIATAIDVIDERLIAAMGQIKLEYGVRDFSEIGIDAAPNLKELKIEAGTVLKLMVEAKTSDQKVSAKIDAAFDALKQSVRHIDKNKIYYYTHRYFE